MERIKLENELLKSVFKDNDFLLKTMRGLFFGFTLTEEQKKLIKDTFKGPELRDVVRRKFFSRLGDECEIGQIADFWAGVPEEKIVGASEEQISQILAPRAKVFGMFVMSMALLENPDGEQVNIEYSLKEGDKLALELLTRNKYMNSIENGLSQIKMVAEHKELTPKEIEELSKKNSSK